MKLVILTAALCLSFNLLIAQDNLIGLKRTTINTKMADAEFKLTESNVTNDNSLKFDVYLSDNGHTLYFYYTATNNECVMAAETYPKNGILNTALDYMNKKYIQITDDAWITKDKEVGVSLHKGTEGFTVRYKKI